jgi:SAM-dependent methyltransferase
VSAEWETHARWWQQGYADGSDPEYAEQILPLVDAWVPPGGVILDLGCGEGQLARRAVTRGGRAVGLDASWTQIAEAARRGGVAPVQGDVTAVPVRTASVDVAVVCLVWEHVADLDAAVGEAARVVRGGGVLMVVLNHPLVQTPGSGWIDDQVLDPPEQYWRLGEYLVESSQMEEVERGVWIRFHHRPLSRYLNTLTSAGFELLELIEPAPPEGFLSAAGEAPAAATIPRLMALRLRRRSD